MAIASIVLSTFDIGLGFVYNFMATVLGSAVFPVACSIYTDKLDATFVRRRNPNPDPNPTLTLTLNEMNQTSPQPSPTPTP